jgi:hypothetical protein
VHSLLCKQCHQSLPSNSPLGSAAVCKARTAARGYNDHLGLCGCVAAGRGRRSRAPDHKWDSVRTDSTRSLIFPARARKPISAGRQNLGRRDPCFHCPISFQFVRHKGTSGTTSPYQAPVRFRCVCPFRHRPWVDDRAGGCYKLAVISRTIPFPIPSRDGFPPFLGWRLNDPKQSIQV